MVTGSVPHNHIAIIGTGFGGIATAVRLRTAGFDGLMPLDRAGDVGGVWRDNDYPGAAVDVKSHLYFQATTRSGLSAGPSNSFMNAGRSAPCLTWACAWCPSPERIGRHETYSQKCTGSGGRDQCIGARRTDG
jgi:cation diffusion facilitator CzcD-associated flavoprotein CzcO